MQLFRMCYLERMLELYYAVLYNLKYQQYLFMYKHMRLLCLFLCELKNLFEEIIKLYIIKLIIELLLN